MGCGASHIAPANPPTEADRTREEAQVQEAGPLESAQEAADPSKPLTAAHFHGKGRLAALVL